MKPRPSKTLFLSPEMMEVMKRSLQKMKQNEQVICLLDFLESSQSVHLCKWKVVGSGK